MNVRILSLEPSYYPRVGGGEKLGHRFNSAFAHQGARVLVLTSVPPISERREMDGVIVDYVRAWRFLGFPWFGLSDLVRTVRELRPTFALLYGPSPYDPIAAIVLRLLRCPFVAVYQADFNERRLAARLATWLHNTLALRAAHAIACTTQRMAERLAARGFSTRTILATPGVDERFFEGAIGEGDGAMLFVGALDDGHAYKRLDLLLDAVALLSAEDASVRLRVVGDGNRRALAERRARDLNIVDRVEFLGAVDDDALAREYSSASVFVLPSPTTQEGFGLVCLEAMASGLPVVCSVNAGAAGMVVRAPGCAVWNARDLADLARAIRVARAAAPERRTALRAFARPFSWSATAKDVLDGILRVEGITAAE